MNAYYAAKYSSRVQGYSSEQTYVPILTVFNLVGGKAAANMMSSGSSNINIKKKQAGKGTENEGPF